MTLNQNEGGIQKSIKWMDPKKGNEAIKRGRPFWKCFEKCFDTFEKMFYGILSRNIIFTKNASICPNFEICIKAFIKHVHRWVTHN